MDCVDEWGASKLGPSLILRALNLSTWQYFVGLASILIYFFYNFLEMHLIGDLLLGMRRNSVKLFYDPLSNTATHLLPKCEILKGRYWPTPWLCSPHLQTAFLHFFGRPPMFQYCRQIFLAPDGGTIALDWLTFNDIVGGDSNLNTPASLHDETPIVIVIPGLTSDSKDPVQTSGLSSTLASSIDKGPYLNVSEDGMVSTDNNICMHSEGDDKVIKEELFLPAKPSIKISGENEDANGEQPHAAMDPDPFMQEPKLEEGSVEYSQLKLSNEKKGSIFEIRIKSCAEFIVLQSALRQLLNQMQASSQGKTVLNAGQKNSETDVFAQFGANKVIDVHKTSDDDFAFCNSDGGAHVKAETGSSNELFVQKQKARDDISNTLVPIKTMMQLSRQQKRSMWILAYIAIVTTWPLVGSVLMFTFKRKVKNMWSATWQKK